VCVVCVVVWLCVCDCVRARVRACGNLSEQLCAGTKKAPVSKHARHVTHATHANNNNARKQTNKQTDKKKQTKSRNTLHKNET
jgi:hypothetical protein